MPLGLAPLVGGSAECRSRALACAPPSGFRAAEGVRSAWPATLGPFGSTPSRISGSAAQKAGKRYERKALAYMQEVLGDGFRSSQWFRFNDNAGSRWCQVDGLCLEGEALVLFEIKTTFTPDAWWQLRKLYEPVVRRAYFPKALGLVIVCKNFDPHVALPEPFELLNELPMCRDLTQMGVFQWRPE